MCIFHVRFISFSLTSTYPPLALGNLVVCPANRHFWTYPPPPLAPQTETLYTVSNFIKTVNQLLCKLKVCVQLAIAA